MADLVARAGRRLSSPPRGMEPDDHRKTGSEPEQATFRASVRLRRNLIVTLHLATGALAGAGVRSRWAAVAVGPPLHLLGDVLPHGEIDSRAFEIGSGLAALSALAVAYGPLHPITLGAASAAAPDLEHVLPLPRPGGRPLFPSHRWQRLHHAGGLPGWAQFLCASIVIGALIRRASGRTVG